LVGINQASAAGGSSFPILKLQNTNGTAGSVYQEMYKTKAGVVNETVGTIAMFGGDSLGNKREFGRIATSIRNPIAGLNGADGALSLFAMKDNNPLECLRVDGGDTSVSIPAYIKTLVSLDTTGQSIVNTNNATTLNIIGSSYTTSPGAVNITGSNGTANGAVQINPGTAGAVSVFTSGFGPFILSASGGSGVGNIFFLQNGTLNQTSFTMGNALAAPKNTTPFYINSIFAGFPSYGRMGIFSDHPHRMRALAYSAANQAATYNGFSGNCFGKATLVLGTVAVSCPSINATTDLVFLTPEGAAATGTVAATLTTGVGFTINSSTVADTRVVSYMVVIGSA
jgi:hypothetical protein